MDTRQPHTSKPLDRYPPPNVKAPMRANVQKRSAYFPMGKNLPCHVLMCQKNPKKASKVLHLISQTFDVNEIAGRCKQCARNVSASSRHGSPTIHAQ